MRWLPIATLLILFVAAPVSAQAPNKAKTTEPKHAEPKPGITVSPGELSATPEMWFYEQYLQQYRDPKVALRQKAEFRTAERARRIQSMKWYGMSNSRPQMNPDPVHGDFAPTWRSGNPYQPNLWSGGSAGTIVVRPSSGTPVERPTYMSVP